LQIAGSARVVYENVQRTEKRDGLFDEAFDNGLLHLLDACFRPEEFVSIAPAAENEDGTVSPRRGVSLSAAEWRKRVEDKGGIDRCFSTKHGLFMRMNPVCKDGASNDDVTAFRHVLVEFDRDTGGEVIAKDVQFGAIVSSGLPVTAVIDSGNKSIHAWVRVDAPDAGEYRRRVDMVWDWLEGLSLDKKNKNPSRLSRCPGGWRTVDGEKRQQHLIALGLGAKSWEEWERARSPDGLPKIVSAAEFMAAPRTEPPQIVAGVLHQGCKMIIGGASKARKSWSLIDLAVSVGSGTPGIISGGSGGSGRRLFFSGFASSIRVHFFWQAVRCSGRLAAPNCPPQR
jgi:hypothetical protein